MQQCLFNQKGQFSYFIYFIVVIIMFLPIILFGFPTLQTVAIGFLEATEPLHETNASIIANINNPEIRADMNSLNNAQLSTQETRISILNDAIIFGVIFIIVIVFVGIYLLSRRNIEVGSLG